jgi:hypothetical protein
VLGSNDLEEIFGQDFGAGYLAFVWATGERVSGGSEGYKYDKRYVDMHGLI